MKTNITLKKRIFNLRSFFSYGGGGVGDWGEIEYVPVNLVNKSVGLLTG